MFNSIRDIIGSLPSHNDDEGFISELPSDVVISNGDKFLSSIPGYYKKILDINNVSYTSHGTIVIDWYFRKNFVSVEVGTTMIGFFTEMPDGINPSSQGISIEAAGTIITGHLNRLFSRSDKL